MPPPLTINRGSVIPFPGRSRQHPSGDLRKFKRDLLRTCNRRQHSGKKQSLTDVLGRGGTTFPADPFLTSPTQSGGISGGAAIPMAAQGAAVMVKTAAPATAATLGSVGAGS